MLASGRLIRKKKYEWEKEKGKNIGVYVFLETPFARKAFAKINSLWVQKCCV
jgi:hypothetical protein